MSRGKIHLVAHRRDSGVHLMACGLLMADAQRVTMSESDVTCMRCIDAIDVTPPPPAAPAHTSEKRLVTGDEIRRLRTAATLRDDAVRPVWWTWQQAVRAVVDDRDEGAPLQSTSRPERFEAHAKGSSEHASGDMAQRRAEVLCEAVDAIGAATLAVTSVVPAERRADVLARVCAGRRDMTRCANSLEVRAKSRVTVRQPQEITAIAQLVGVSDHAIRMLVRDMGAIIESRLGGLVSLREERSDMRRIAEADCVGWDDIGMALGGVTADTARRWRTEYEGTRTPMPVALSGGRMRGHRSELRDWLDEVHGAKTRRAASR